jgi:hypothetical protein
MARGFLEYAAQVARKRRTVQLRADSGTTILTIAE